MDQKERDYFAARERAERTAAKNARCPQARRAHQELARAYADKMTQRERYVRF